jgi:hypothetical protein
MNKEVMNKSLRSFINIHNLFETTQSIARFGWCVGVIAEAWLKVVAWQ